MAVTLCCALNCFVGIPAAVVDVDGRVCSG
eukprot:COSAG02_NODE_24932_length_673_cov_14.585366_2_plen_29_part_01